PGRPRLKFMIFISVGAQFLRLPERSLPRIIVLPRPAGENGPPAGVWKTTRGVCDAMVQAVLRGHPLWLRNHDVRRHKVVAGRGAWLLTSARRRTCARQGFRLGRRRWFSAVELQLPELRGRSRRNGSGASAEPIFGSGQR